MLKKVLVKQLRMGMYVHELCASWLDTPLWSTSFMIDSSVSLDKIGASGIADAWIDTAKGLDIEGIISPMAQLGAEPYIESTKVAGSYKNTAFVSLEEELGTAVTLLNQSKMAVCTMFNEARMGKAVKLERAMPLVEEIAASIMRNPGAFIGLVRLKTADDYTYMHSVAVCALMIVLSRQLDLNEVETREAGLAGLLHDIGKMAVPSDILNKPGKLSDTEFSAIKQHPAQGHRMLVAAGGVNAIALDVCLHHHEKIDGTGYPDGLAGDQIGMYARMGAICDVYDAMTSNRPYKRGWCPAESLQKMAKWSEGHFDPTFFSAFVKCIGIYPVGTLVRLKSGRLGVVVEQQIGKSLLLPKVRVFFSSKSLTYITPELINLATPGLKEEIVMREDAEKWGLKDIDRFWHGGDS